MRVNLRAVNSYYVSAVNGGGGDMRPWAKAPWDWETFNLFDQTGNGELYSGDLVWIQVANGMYMCAENGGGAQIVANRTTPLGWETFRIDRHGTGSGPITSNTPVTLSVPRGPNGERWYVCAESAGTGVLVCNRTAVGDWEVFRFDRKGDDPRPAYNTYRDLPLGY